MAEEKDTKPVAADEPKTEAPATPEPEPKTEAPVAAARRTAAALAKAEAEAEARKADETINGGRYMTPNGDVVDANGEPIKGK